jgi:hypothetical protein
MREFRYTGRFREGPYTGPPLSGKSAPIEREAQPTLCAECQQLAASGLPVACVHVRPTEEER